MNITAVELKKEIANLEAQAVRAANTYQQATGALALARALLERIEADEVDAIPLDDFVEMVGGEGATAVIESNGKA